MAIAVPLTRGYVAWVDDEDAWVLDRKWYAKLSRGNVYAMRIEEDKAAPLHRLIAKPVGREQTDHMDGDTLNNRRSNLRNVSHSENQRNTEGPQGPNPYKGVSKRGERWRAYIYDGERSVHLGYFSTPEEANRVRLDKEREMWGIHPRRAVAHAG